MRKLNKREKILATAVGGLLLLFMFKLLIFDPLRQRLISVRDEIGQAQLSIRKYSEIVERKDDILKAQRQVERYLSLKGNDEENMGAVLTKIESEARKSKLSILDMNPQTQGASARSASFPRVYSVQLRAEADMEGIFDFIYNLENADILFKLDKLDLSIKDEGGKIIKMEARILGISLS